MKINLYEIFTSVDRFRRYALGMIFFTTIYFIWLIWAPKTALGYVFLLLEIIMHVMVLIFVITNWNREYKMRGGGYSLRTPVDVLISTINEAEEVLRPTIQSAIDIEHPNTHVYVLDDGEREWVRELCEELGAEYMTRGAKAVQKKPYKAGNMNFAFRRTFGVYILALDADQRVAPTIFDDVLGHFDDKKVGYVTTKQRFEVPPDDFNHDHLFYEYMQAGKASFGSPVSTGSGAVYRRKALERIGGFQEWNIVEDLYTSVKLNEEGYRGVYVSQAYTVGTAPRRLKNIYKQRGTWAHDSLRMFIYKNPLFNRKLSFMQRLTYFELAYIYFVGAFFIPGIFFLDMYSLLLNEPILKVGLSYLAFKLPSFIFILFVYNLFSRGASSTSMWTSLSPIYLLGLFKALLYRRPKYKTTAKKEKKKTQAWEILYAWPHIFLLLSLTYALTFHYLTYDFSLFLVVKVSWIVILLLLMFPIFPRIFDLSPKQERRSLIYVFVSLFVLAVFVFLYERYGIDQEVAGWVYEIFFAPAYEVIQPLR